MPTSLMLSLHAESRPRTETVRSIRRTRWVSTNSSPGAAPRVRAQSLPMPGQYFVVYLSPRDYHRVHAPAGGTVATINLADSDGLGILRKIYPSSPPLSAVPAGKKLVVFGLGPLNGLIGGLNQQSLLTDAPFYSNTNQSQYYNRFLCVFEVSASGSRARLMAVLGADGDRIDEEVADFYEQ